MLFAAQMVKASCDVIIGVVGEVYKPAKVVSIAYSGVVDSADLAGRKIAGDQISKADYAKAVNAGGSAVFKKLGADTPYANLADLNKIKTDMVINAMAMDEDGVWESLREYNFTLSTWALELAGKQAFSTMLTVGAELSKAAGAYRKAINDWNEGDLDATFDSGIAISRRQLTTITSRISELERSLIACGEELPRFLSPSTRLLTGNFSGPTIRPGR